MQLENLYQAKAKLSGLVNAALAGEEVYICKAGKPAVRLVPVQACQEPEPDPCRATPGLAVRGTDEAITVPLDPSEWGELG